MKKITLALTLSVLPATLAFNSCQKEDDTLSLNNAKEIIAMESITWNCDSVFADNVLGPFLSGMEGMEEVRDTIAGFLKDKSYNIDVDGKSVVATESYKAYAQMARYSTANIRYWSVDGNGDPIALSARLAWNYDTGRKITGIVVHLHETIFDNASAPSVYKSNTMERLAIDDNLVIIPDFIGLGASVSERQTYLSHELCARNCLDAIIAAINACKDSVKWPDLPHSFAPDAGTYLTGFSQGGAIGLALNKYLDTKATQQERDMVNLKHSFLGSGPYNPSATFQRWMDEGRMVMPVLLPLTIDGIQAGGDANLKGLDVNSCFTDTFNNCGFLQKIYDKKTNLTLFVIETIAKLRPYSSRNDDKGEILPYFSLDAILSQEGKNSGSDMRKRIEKALANQNLLSGNWTPSAPITFFYTSKDDVVPPVNTILAYNKWKNSGKVHVIDCEAGEHILAWIPFEIYAVRFDLYKEYKNIQRNAEVKFLVNKMTQTVSDALFKLY